MANDKSLKDVVTYIHKKTASLALIVTLHVAWPKRVGIYSKLIKQDNKENINHMDIKLKRFFNVLSYD